MIMKIERKVAVYEITAFGQKKFSRIYLKFNIYVINNPDTYSSII